MKVTEIFEQSVIDNVNGAGAVPYNQEIDYFGLRVMMKPTVFAQLALPLDRSGASYEGIKQHIQNGGKIGAPFLIIAVPPEWEDGDFSNPAAVKNHEGRNRMVALEQLYGDQPVEVHLIFSGGLRSRDITPEWVAQLNARLLKERSTEVVSGPLFTM